VPIVVYSNSAREQINLVGILKVATPDNPAYSYALKVTMKNGQVPNEDIVRAVTSDYNNHSGFESILYVVVGMPVVVTANVSLAHGVANGTEGVVVGIINDKQATCSVCYMNQPQSIYRASVNRMSRMAKCILIRVTGGTFKFDGLDEGVFPLFPRAAKKVVTVPNMNAKLDLMLESFPLSPMFACTGHKTQAKTMAGIIISSFENLPKGWLYVALSRTRSLDDIFLTQPVTLKLLSNSGPSDAVTTEMDRLKKLHSETVERLSLQIQTFQLQQPEKDRVLGEWSNKILARLGETKDVPMMDDSLPQRMPSQLEVVDMNKSVPDPSFDQPLMQLQPIAPVPMIVVIPHSVHDRRFTEVS
jgi:hypothetical protein